jgi:hypothetical protein
MIQIAVRFGSCDLDLHILMIMLLDNLLSSARAMLALIIYKLCITMMGVIIAVTS